MIRTILACLATTALIGACAPDPSSDPPMPARDPFPTAPPVSGAQAFDGAPCAFEDDIGRDCVRRGETCADGGNRPSVMQCVLHRWRCVVDVTRPCAATRPASVCPTGTEIGTCTDLGFCGDGTTPVPARWTCLGDRWACLAVAPGCPPSPTDAGVPPEDAPNRALTLVSEGPVGRTVYPGNAGIIIAQYSAAADQAVSLNEQPRLTVMPVSGQIADDHGRTVLWNLRVVDLDDGRVVSGPYEFLVGADRRLLTPRLPGRAPIDAGRTRRFGYVVDVPAGIDAASLGIQFRAILGAGDGNLVPPGSVTDGDGLPVPNDALVGNRTALGNVFTIARQTVSIGLSGEFHSRLAVKNTAEVYSGRMVVSSDQDGTLRRFPVFGVGNVGSGFSPSAFGDVMLACALFEGTRRLAAPRVPEPTGRIDFTGLDLRLLRGTAHALDVVCRTDSVIANRPSGDVVAIGLPSASDVEIVSDRGERLTVMVEDALAAQLTAPTAVVTVLEHGGVGIATSPSSTQTVLGGTAPLVATAHRLTSTIEEFDLTQIAVAYHGTIDCIQDVMVMRDGVVIASQAMVPFSTNVTFTLIEPARILTTGTGIATAVRLRTPTADGSNGCPVGSAVTVGLAYGLTTRPWDVSYGGSPSMRVVGVDSGDAVHLTGESMDGATFIVR